MLSERDPKIFDLINKETQLQRDNIILIASENYVSWDVLEAEASVLTNKYAEGYPGARYYSGCGIIDEIERLAISRVKELFHAEYANVQPHSGSQANMAAYFAVLQPGDTILGMSLAHGGHLTHGSPVSFSGKLFHFVHYGVNRKTELLDYNEVRNLALQYRPKLIVSGASAYSRIIDFARLRNIADAVGARLMVDMAHIAGLVAAGVHPSPVPYADIVTSTTHKTLRGPRGGFILCRQELAKKIDSAVFPGVQGGPLEQIIAAKAVAFVEAMRPEFKTYQKAVVENACILAEELQKLGLRIVSGGTDNHLMLVDLSSTGITGNTCEKALEAIGICVNRNAIPFDTQSPRITSGIRLGTPVVTTRGFGPTEIRQVARIIYEIITNIDDVDIKMRAQKEVLEICHRFPVSSPPWWN